MISPTKAGRRTTALRTEPARETRVGVEGSYPDAWRRPMERAFPIAKAVRHLEAGHWKAAHEIVQKDSSTLGCWVHGIVHLIEGDLANAQYWYRRAHRSLPHGNTAAAEIAALKEQLGGATETAKSRGAGTQ